MLAAWRLFASANAWGTYKARVHAKRLRAAGRPKDVRPYQLRYTVGIRLSEAGVDLADVAAWMGRRRLDTTRQRYVPVLQSRMQAAAEKVARRDAWHANMPQRESVAIPKKQDRSLMRYLR